MRCSRRSRGVLERGGAQARAVRTCWGCCRITERKNSWWLAEFAGDVSPDGMQRLLNFSPWDEDACRDAVRAVRGEESRGPGGGAGGGRDGVPEEGKDVGRRGQAVHRAPPGGSRTRRSACSWPMPGQTAAGR